MYAAQAQQASSHQAQLVNAITPLRSALADHRMYRELSDRERLRTFMESHVFAVWDFMTLVKRLQNRLTCVQTPWQPPPDPLSARLINEIVLGEESDRTPDGRVGSHFEFYVEAMREIGANTQPIQTFLQCLQNGQRVASALAHAGTSRSTALFVLNTMSTAERATHEVAASFLLGREVMIPVMFERVLAVIAPMHAPTLKWYLERHIELDGDEHGPAGWHMLAHLCGQDQKRWVEAELSARRALESRRMLWDGVAEVFGVEARERSHSFVRLAVPKGVNDTR